MAQEKYNPLGLGLLTKVGSGFWQMRVPCGSSNHFYATRNVMLPPEISAYYDFLSEYLRQPEPRTGIAQVFGDDYWRELTAAD